jgi:adenosylcobinamide kinase / adenosylcobinamide-phosphate guanylyltransferase
MLTLILGGARSGKSRHAQSLAAAAGEPVVVVATATSEDPEMAERIARHRADRPPHWKTIEAPLDVVAAVRAASAGVVLVDCATIWISNLLYEHRGLDRATREKTILEDVETLAEVSREGTTIIVSNEVGEGIVPESPVAREFRDLQGQANQILARASSSVVLVVAGVPLALKAPN